MKGKKEEGNETNSEKKIDYEFNDKYKEYFKGVELKFFIKKLIETEDLTEVGITKEEDGTYRFMDKIFTTDEICEERTKLFTYLENE